MTAAVRLQLSRAKGFNLQAHSRAVNGLEAVKVDRSTQFGNMFIVNPHVRPGAKSGACYICVPVEDAVECFREFTDQHPEEVDRAQKELRGRNIGCWCNLCSSHKATGKPLGVSYTECAPCHADVLLEIANR